MLENVGAQILKTTKRIINVDLIVSNVITAEL
jgi:hypothetical protein